MLKLETVVSTYMYNNTYIVWDDESGEGAVIDPSMDAGAIISGIEKAGCSVKYIILTHLHFDHAASTGDIKSKFGGEVVCHRSDLPNVAYFSSKYPSQFDGFQNPDRFVEHGERLMLGGEELLFYHTPGHSQGSVCIAAGDWLFTGDTLFHDDVGRTDLFGGSADALHESIRDVLGGIGRDYIVLPGHEEASTLAYEKENNRFFR